ncbi:hypothetical protein ACFOY2_54075 [Nonomuraea purpurea]|uniref:Uncharacterized protein n=1 Tax=Nonomuraea purpurea TaxID=1849276 RepID=A0ABV8GU09_9ACTN
MTAELTTYEARWRAVCDGLDRHPGVEISYTLDKELDLGFADAAASWQALVAPLDVDAPAGLEQCHLRFGELGRQWGTREPHRDLNGEFYLHHIALADAPAYEDWITGKGEAGFPTSQLRIIDQHPVTGTGRYAALRLLPGGGEPELWWVAGPHYGEWKMDIGYREYLEALQLTKGAFDWQFLFTRAPLGEEWLEPVRRRVENMLETLPTLFPEHDYTPFMERFAARP